MTLEVVFEAHCDGPRCLRRAVLRGNRLQRQAIESLRFRGWSVRRVKSEEPSVFCRDCTQANRRTAAKKAAASRSS